MMSSTRLDLQKILSAAVIAFVLLAPAMLFAR
jgi:hypothetical protein